MTYFLLDAEDQADLLRERVRQLEADHFRNELLLIEVEHDPKLAEPIRARMAELRRRIVQHVGEAPEAEGGAERETTVAPVPTSEPWPRSNDAALNGASG